MSRPTSNQTALVRQATVVAYKTTWPSSLEHILAEQDFAATVQVKTVVVEHEIHFELEVWTCVRGYGQSLDASVCGSIARPEVVVTVLHSSILVRLGPLDRALDSNRVDLREGLHRAAVVTQPRGNLTSTLQKS